MNSKSIETIQRKLEQIGCSGETIMNAIRATVVEAMEATGREIKDDVKAIEKVESKMAEFKALKFGEWMYFTRFSWPFNTFSSSYEYGYEIVRENPETHEDGAIASVYRVEHRSRSEYGMPVFDMEEMRAMMREFYNELYR